MEDWLKKNPGYCIVRPGMTIKPGHLVDKSKNKSESANNVSNNKQNQSQAKNQNRYNNALICKVF